MSSNTTSNTSRQSEETPRPSSAKSEDSPEQPTLSRKSGHLAPNVRSRSTLGGPGKSVSSRVSFFNDLTQASTETSRPSGSSDPLLKKDKDKNEAVYFQPNCPRSVDTQGTVVPVAPPPRARGKGRAVSYSPQTPNVNSGVTYPSPLKLKDKGRAATYQASVAEAVVSNVTTIQNPKSSFIPSPQTGPSPPTLTLASLVTPAKKLFRMAQAVISPSSASKAQPVGKLSTSVEVEVEATSGVFTEPRYMESDRTINNFFQDETGARVVPVRPTRAVSPGGLRRRGQQIMDENENKYKEDSKDWDIMMDRRREEAKNKVRHDL
ncbi:hypothetical protein NX059_008225 [Plenodomus lindquistii]|nr:hypothetical protein NX059_008225 [Plenodomus lindquistii]